jgi:antibiotic biosynthesis monooxygenase (ABM) superfamily enzyme
MKNHFIHRNISAHPLDGRFNVADQKAGFVAASEMPLTARTNEKIVLPRRTGGRRFGPLLYGLAALFVVGSVLGASQADSQPGLVQFSQQGPKLVGTGVIGLAEQGWSLALSADGNTAIVGGLADNKITGAAWVYTRSGDVWSQQGNKLVGAGVIGSAGHGFSVALSADGNTAIVGGPYDNAMTGAAWVYTRNGDVWTQQGNKLVGTDAVGSAGEGVSVGLSGDGNTAIVGGGGDNSSTGAAWIYTRNGGVWTQQGSKLVGLGAVGKPGHGFSVALSGDGNTAIVGGLGDNANTGAAWVYTRNGDVWTQQGNKLVGTGAVGAATHGSSVALSGDGNTAIVGGRADNSNAGAAWIYTRNGGVWTQQGSKLVGTGAVGNAGHGISVALSADGNTAIVGGVEHNSSTGAAWVYARSGNVWTQQGNMLVGNDAVGHARQGHSVALSADGSTAIVGGVGDNRVTGATWVHTRSGGVWTTPAQHLGF